MDDILQPDIPGYDVNSPNYYNTFTRYALDILTPEEEYQRNNTFVTSYFRV